MNTEQWYTDDALMLRWWCADDALMMCSRCTDDTQTIHRWWTESSFQKYSVMLGLSGTSSYAVFVYLCICIFVYACLTHGNIIFDILEQSCFQKYTTCWVFLALRHNLCICIFCTNSTPCPGQGHRLVMGVMQDPQGTEFASRSVWSWKLSK